MPKNSYLMELRKKDRALRARVKKLAAELDKLNPLSDGFMDKYKALNEAKIKHEAVKSRMRNFRSNVIIPEAHPYNGQIPAIT